MQCQKTVLGGLLLVVAAVIGLLPNGLRADAGPSPRQSRPQKIAELAADLGYGAEAKHVDAAVPYLAKTAASNDPTWNATHRRWPAVCALIRQNLRDDAQESFGESDTAIMDGAERALNKSVAEADLDVALAFFRSTAGRHYLELQNSLADMSVELSLENDAGAGGNPVDNLDARKRILELWLPIVFIRAMDPEQSVERTVDTAYKRFARQHGQQLDALALRYGDDLPQIETFIKSEEFGKIIEAEKGAGQQAPAPNLPAFFSAEAKKHAAQWRAAAAGA